MGLQNVAELLTREPRPETMASAAKGTKAQGNNINERHSCKCGICDACTEPPRPPTPTCHHVACHSQRECTIFPGHKPAQFVHPDNRGTAKIAWLPTNFWAEEAPAQSEQVSQIKSSFKLDEDRELITSVTSAVQSGMKALQRRNVNQVRQWKTRRCLDIGEDLFKAGLLSKESPLFNIISAHFDGNSSSDSSSSSNSRPSSSSNDGEDEQILRFQALLICSTKVDKMVSDGEITEEQKPQVLVKQVEKVLQALDNKPKGKKSDKHRPKNAYPAHAQFRDERMEPAKARAARSIRAAAHGSEPTIRSRLSGEVWNASPTKPVSQDDDNLDSKANFSSSTETISDPDHERDNKQDANDDIIAFLSAMNNRSSSSAPDSNVASRQVRSEPKTIQGISNPGSERDEKQDTIDEVIAFLSAMGRTASFLATQSNVSRSQVAFQSAAVQDIADPNSENDDRKRRDVTEDKTKARSMPVRNLLDADSEADKTYSYDEQPKSKPVGEETGIFDRQPKTKPGGDSSHHADDDDDDDSDDEEVILFKGRRRRF